MKTKKRELITVVLVIGLIVVITMAYMIYMNKITGNKNIANSGNNSENPQALAEGETWTAETLKATVDTSTWDLNKVNIVESADGIPVPVPKGFFASELEGENTVLGGFVIYSGEEPIKGVLDEEGNKTDVLGTYSADPDSYWQQSCNRNQWVWVPCPDTSRIYETDETTGKKRAKLWELDGSQKVSRDNEYREPARLSSSSGKVLIENNALKDKTILRWEEDLEIEFETTMKSIEKYGGFYIGRYETGNVSQYKGYEPNIKKTPVVVRMNNNITYSRWLLNYNNIPKIEQNDYIKCNMIWGCLWDETLQWLIDSGNKTFFSTWYDSSTWGNCRNASPFTYTTINGGTVTTKKDFAAEMRTGNSEHNNANNIYDLAGNVLEVTLEKESSMATRGGKGKNGVGSVCAATRESAGAYHVEQGARAYFYIK